ncbi:hypothetical protein ALC60_06397, partial [Trachymyrmex zeteki]
SPATARSPVIRPVIRPAYARRRHAFRPHPSSRTFYERKKHTVAIDVPATYEREEAVDR